MGTRVARLVAMAAIAGSQIGCHGPDKPVFDVLSQEIAWPSPPSPARVRYVGSIRTAADLKPRQTGSEFLARIFGGRKPPEPLYGPRAVTVTSDGTKVWVADPGGRCIHLLNLETRTYQKIERAGGQRLLSPVDICPGPAGSLYACDSEAVAVHRLSEEDGSWIETLRLPEELQRPVALYHDPSTQELFIVDILSHDIKVFDAENRLTRTIGKRGEKPGEFNFPLAITSSEEILWVADTGNNRIQGIRRSGEPVASFGRAGDASGDLAMPKSVAVDKDGHLYVVDGRFENIQIFNQTGELLLYFGEEGTGPGQFWLPGGLWIEPNGRIWVCDSYNRRLQVFQYVGEPDADD